MFPQHKSRIFFAGLLIGLLALAGAAFAQQPAITPPPVSGMPQVGQIAPNFKLQDQDGKTHHLKDYRGQIVLLAFYPADFTTGCTIEAHTMTAAYKDFRAAGITPIGMSVQNVQSHKEFCEKEGIPYTLLADSQRKVAARYGVLMQIPKIGGVANRVTFIVGKNGHVVYVDPNVNQHLTTCAEDWITWVKSHQDVCNSQ